LFKKAGIIALAAAGLLLAGGPAFASPYPADDASWSQGSHSNGQFGALNAGRSGSDSNEQLGAVNTGDLDVADAVTVPVCLSDTNVSVGIVVAVVADILSPSGQLDSCDAAVIQENGDR
jgi:hypothetical protein